VRAGAASRRPSGEIRQCIRAQPRQVGGLTQHVDHLLPVNLVKDVPAFPPGDHQAGLAQDHKVLGDGRLPDAHHSPHMAYAGFARTQDHQDLDAHWLPYYGQQFGYSLFGEDPR